MAARRVGRHWTTRAPRNTNRRPREGVSHRIRFGNGRGYVGSCAGGELQSAVRRARCSCSVQPPVTRAPVFPPQPPAIAHDLQIEWAYRHDDTWQSSPAPPLRPNDTLHHLLHSGDGSSSSTPALRFHTATAWVIRYNLCGIVNWRLIGDDRSKLATF